MFQYVILGIIQGVTEFLPVSSSAHLIILQKLLGLSGNELEISVVLHLGTCLALIIFFFKDILKLLKDMRLLFLIAVVSVITGIIGVSGKDFFEGLFSSLELVSITLLITGAILLSTRKFLQGKRKDLNVKDACILGITQAIAIIPGISRSGITISTLLFRKVDRELSFRFSFLASIPAVLGAALLEARKMDLAVSTNGANFFAGFIFSLLFGIFSLWFLRKILIRAKFYYFGYYCILVGILVLLLK